MVGQDEVQHSIHAHGFSTVVLLLVRLRPLQAVLVVFAHVEGQRSICSLLGHTLPVSIVTEVVQLLPVQADRLDLQHLRVGKGIGIRSVRLAHHVAVLVISIRPTQGGVYGVRRCAEVDEVRDALLA